MAIDLNKRIHSDEAQKKKQGSDVVVAGFVAESKVMGKLAFIKLRDRGGYIQLVSLDKKLVTEIGKLTRESVIAVQGKIKKSKLKAGGNEIEIKNLEVVSKAETPLPIDFSGKIETDLSKRLDWRCLDLRNPKVQAIFEIQSEICGAFRDFFRKQRFIEYWQPGIISAAAEGGTELFAVDYFGKKCFLAQSPELYKEMLTSSNLEKIFSINPIWRAEKHDTYKHLNEIRQMDIEVAFANQKNIMKYLEDAIKFIVGEVKKTCKKQLEILKRNLEIPKVKYISYNEAIQVLSKKNLKIKFGEDISTEGEKLLAKIYGEQTLIFIYNWPLSQKPFYIMPNSKNPKLSKGFDADYGGMELASGGQRIHIPELLIKRLKANKLDPKDFKFFIDAFKYGATPHAGWSIGLERLTMIICGLNNIREACLWPRDKERLTP